MTDGEDVDADLFSSDDNNPGFTIHGNDEEASANSAKCKSCHIHAIKRLLNPCCHLICITCATFALLNNCPLCRGVVQDVTNVFC